MITKEKMRPFWKYSLFLLVVFAFVTIVLNSLIRKGFYYQSLNYITKLQQYSNSHLTVFMNVMSLLANTHFLHFVLITLYFSFKRKIAVIVFCTYFLLNSYFLNLMKASYQQPRPFWSSNQIKLLQWQCPSKFGNPSGHSWMVILIYEPLVSDFLSSGYCHTWYIFPTIAGILIPFSRIYLGSHTGNQIMMGLTLGIIMCALYRLKIQKLIYKLYFTLQQKISCRGYFLLIVVNVLCILIPLGIYTNNIQNHPVSIHPYLVNLNLKCNSTEYSSNSIHASSLKEHAIVNLVFGMMFGMSLAPSNNYLYLLGKWSLNSATTGSKMLKGGLRIVLQLIISSPAVLILVYGVPCFVQNLYLEYVSMCVGFWLCGFTITCFSSWMLLEWRIIIHKEEKSESRVKCIKERACSDQLFYT